MPDSSAVLTAFRDELLIAGLVRRPRDAGPLPPMHVEPRDGAPGPGDRADGATDVETAGDLVVTLRLSGELGEGPGDSYRRRVIADVLYRSTGTAGLKAGRLLDAAIRRRIVDRNDYGVGYTLAAAFPSAVFVLQAGIYGGLGAVSEAAGVRTELAKYALEVSSS